MLKLKTMIRLLLILTILFSSTIARGQKYGNIWQFGNQVGLDFNNCNPVVISGAVPGFEGCSSIADSNGQLLFYTNSEKVWNRLNSIMTNGNLISGGSSLSQVIIIPKPLSISTYYIITTKIQATGNLSLQYHNVDMTLNGGLGDVQSKNNILSNLNITEQICATNHNNGTDIWLMTHEYGTSNFLAYLVTSTGITTTPVISNVGPAHISCNSNTNARGEIKFSPNGNKIAFNGNGVGGNDPSNILSVFDFDNNTGIVSNPLNLPFSRGDYGLSFSPDNSKLYGTTWKALNFGLNEYNYLYQFDLSSGNSSTIVNSKQIIDSLQFGGIYGTLKIGPDGKIYVRYINSSYLGVINSPNLSGTACNYIKNGFYIGNQTYQYGLNNYIEYSQYCNTTGILTHNGKQHGISITPNPFSIKTVIQSDIFLHNAVLTIYNCFGQTVNEIQNIQGMTINFNRDNLANGIYFIRLTDDNITLAKDKLIISD
jgi:Secretion system C-terminal sorting domain